MRTPVQVALAFAIALFTWTAQAQEFPPSHRTETASTHWVAQGVTDFSEVLCGHLERTHSLAVKLEDDARLQRILKRRGPKLSPGWFERQRPTTARDVASPGSVDPRIVRTVRDFNQDLSARAAEELAAELQAASVRYGVDPLLLTALVSQESAFHQSARSPVGATGLGQLMPETAAELGVDPHDRAENLDGAARYLADLLYYWSQSEDPITLALASYNTGAGNVERYSGVPPFEETQHYVTVITHRYAALRAGQRLLS